MRAKTYPTNYSSIYTSGISVSTSLSGEPHRSESSKGKKSFTLFRGCFYLCPKKTSVQSSEFWLSKHLAHVTDQLFPLSACHMGLAACIRIIAFIAFICLCLQIAWNMSNTSRQERTIKTWPNETNSWGLLVDDGQGQLFCFWSAASTSSTLLLKQQ